MLKTAIRVICQILIAGPAIIYFPFSILVCIGSLQAMLHNPSEVQWDSFILGLGWIGLLGLYASILIPVSVFQKRRMTRWLVSATLVEGLLVTGWILVASSKSSSMADNLNYLRCWVFGGPLFVGIWNLARIIRASKTSTKSLNCSCARIQPN